MKRYDITIRRPWNPEFIEMHSMVSQNLVDLEANTFHYNDHYPACPILEIKEVDPAYIDAEAKWCERYGTQF